MAAQASAVNMNLFDPTVTEVFLDEMNSIGVRNKESGQTHTGLKVALMFPLTSPDTFVQFTDDQENEIGILKQIGDLDEGSKSVVMAEIEKTYFIPAITKIISINSGFGADVWKVETDKGPRTFEVVGKRRNIRFLSSNHVIIKDIDGNRYEIPSVARLGKMSQRLLQREV